MKVRREFTFVAKGPTERRKCVVVQARRRRPPRAATGAGFTATKTVGNAVIRNRSRRRLRECVRQLLPRLGMAGVDYVFIARGDTATAPWERLLDDIEKALVSLRRRIAAGEDVQPPRPKRPSAKPNATRHRSRGA
ncbi:MAG: ribonuclease P protein component [Hyphomonadaceae bacterium]